MEIETIILVSRTICTEKFVTNSKESSTGAKTMLNGAVTAHITI